MPEQYELNFADVVKAAQAEAKNGSEILEALNPDLDWVNLRDLVGERLLIISMADSEPGLGTQALRIIYADEEGNAARFSTEHDVVIEQLRSLRPYLPVNVTVGKATSQKGMEYFILQ